MPHISEASIGVVDLPGVTATPAAIMDFSDDLVLDPADVLREIGKYNNKTGVRPMAIWLNINQAYVCARAILPADEQTNKSLKRAAEGISSLYGCTVYLHGRDKVE